jgi:hypothetical protein
VTVAFFVAATVVTTLQFLRVRERRLLPLLGLFALTAVGHSLDDTGWGRFFLLAGGASALALVVMLAPRHVPPPEKPR